MATKMLWAALVTACSAALLLLVVLRNPVWTVDGFSYTRMMLEDAGLTRADALKIAQDFYQTLPLGHNPRYAAYFTYKPAHEPPAIGPILRPRVLYPWLASLLYPRRSIPALLDVSGAAYLIGCLAMFWLLLALVRPWLAAVGALAFAVSPLVLARAEAALTDMLALALWVIALGALFYSLQTRQSVWIWIVLFAGACVALVFTRPMLYLPAGAVAGALISARIRRDAANAMTVMVLSAVIVATALGDYIRVKLMHGAGLGDEIDLTHKLAMRSGLASSSQTIQSWYRQTVFRNAVDEIKHGIRAVLPVLGVVAAAVEIRRSEIAVLLGAAVAGIAPLLFDPASYDLPRVLETPLYPVILSALALGAEGFLVSRKFHCTLGALNQRET